MTKPLTFDYFSIGDHITVNNGFMYHNQGIDTIQLVAKYEMVIKLVERMGLHVVEPSKNSPVSETLNKVESVTESKKRLKKEQFQPKSQVVKLSKGKSLSNYMMITQNTPYLFDIATHHKKAKDTYCLITFAGLHQPTKKISSEAMKIVSKFLKRKTFKLHSLDVAIDTADRQSISHERKGAFKDNLMPYSKRGVISKGSSLYINDLNHHSMSRVLYYDKYFKQTKHHKQEGISNDLSNWKRLEVTFKFDVTQKENRGFIHYIESLNFVDDLYEVQVVASKAKVQHYMNDYLAYQLNSILDNRFMNNDESKRQFNSVESLERFKQSEFRRYTLVI
jgi:hypothetical protein